MEEDDVSNSHAAECLTDGKDLAPFARGWSHTAFLLVSRLWTRVPKSAPSGASMFARLRADTLVDGIDGHL